MQHDHSTNAKMSIHFIEPDAQIRATLMQAGLSLGYHCEIYADYSELAAYPPRSGVIVVRDCTELGGIAIGLSRLMNLGIALPVIAMDTAPTPDRVVNAVKAGALDYLVLPLRPERLSACLSRIGQEAMRVSEARRRTINAQRQLSQLSPREYEVLEALSSGLSNKEIARVLNISPRTVEIHRANMMAKLGERHSAGAIRIKMEAGLGFVSAPAMPMPAYA